MPAVNQGVMFVIGNTGHMYHLYVQDDAGRLQLVRHDSLPAWNVAACLNVIAALGHKHFTVYIG